MAWLKALLKAFVLPPTGPLLLAAAGRWMMGRIPRAGRILAWTGILLLLALSTPTVAFLLLTLLDNSPPLDVQRARSAQAIVILGGGVRRHAAEYGGDTLGHLTLERVRYGAHVARATGLPVLVTGGSVFGGEPEAKLMRAALEREFDVRVRWAETRSRNTRENAVRSAEILGAEHISRIVLVAHSFDMPRAKAEFAAQGIEAIAAPTGIPDGGFDTPLDVLPSLAALQGSYFALYEIFANIARWITLNVGTPISKEQHAYFVVPCVVVSSSSDLLAPMAGTANMDSLPQPVVYGRRGRNMNAHRLEAPDVGKSGVPSRLGLKSAPDVMFIKHAVTMAP